MQNQSTCSWCLLECFIIKHQTLWRLTIQSVHGKICTDMLSPYINEFYTRVLYVYVYKYHTLVHAFWLFWFILIFILAVVWCTCYHINLNNPISHLASIDKLPAIRNKPERHDHTAKWNLWADNLERIRTPVVRSRTRPLG